MAAGSTRAYVRTGHRLVDAKVDSGADLWLATGSPRKSTAGDRTADEKPEEEESQESSEAQALRQYRTSQSKRTCSSAQAKGSTCRRMPGNSTADFSLAHHEARASDARLPWPSRKSWAATPP
eukprot:2443290-Rhodomonas_salina.1